MMIGSERAWGMKIASLIENLRRPPNYSIYPYHPWDERCIYLHDMVVVFSWLSCRYCSPMDALWEM